MAPFEESVPHEAILDGEQVRVPVRRLPPPLEFELLRVPPARLGKTFRVEVQLNRQTGDRLAVRIARTGCDSVVVHLDVEPPAFLLEPPIEHLGYERVVLPLPKPPATAQARLHRVIWFCCGCVVLL